MVDKKVKAYHWNDEQTGYSLIVWAETPGRAKRQIADSEGMNFIDVNVCRLPWADKYTNMDEIPAKEYFAHGWQLCCCNCGELYPEEDLIVTETEPICKYCYNRMIN